MNRDTLFYLLPIPLIWLSRTAVSSDAAIYFTFVQAFSDLPFSFQPGVVSFGATAPLHVLWQVPLYALLGDPYWLALLPWLNAGWFILGGLLIGRASRAPGWLVCWVLLLNVLLFTTAAQGYETPLAFAAVALAFSLMRTGRGEAVLALGGTLYLIRPEFALITAVWGAYWLYHTRQWVRTTAVGLLGLLPALLYHSYLFWHTGTWLPSSVVARAASDLSWWGRVQQTAAAGLYPASLIWMLFFCLLAYAAWRRVPVRGTPSVGLALAWIVVWCVPYLLWPPGPQLWRYLLPVTAVFIPFIAALPEATSCISPSAGGYLVILALFLHIPAVLTLQRVNDWPPLPDILLADLATNLAQTPDLPAPLTAEVGLLAVNSAGQYSLPTALFGLDGVVGGYDLSDPAVALEKYNIRYLVVGPGMAAEPWLTAVGAEWKLILENSGESEQWTAVYAR